MQTSNYIHPKAMNTEKASILQSAMAVSQGALPLSVPTVPLLTSVPAWTRLAPAQVGIGGWLRARMDWGNCSAVAFRPIYPRLNRQSLGAWAGKVDESISGNGTLFTRASGGKMLGVHCGSPPAVSLSLQPKPHTHPCCPLAQWCVCVCVKVNPHAGSVCWGRIAVGKQQRRGGDTTSAKGRPAFYKHNGWVKVKMSNKSWGNQSFGGRQKRRRLTTSPSEAASMWVTGATCGAARAPPAPSRDLMQS